MATAATRAAPAETVQYSSRERKDSNGGGSDNSSDGRNSVNGGGRDGSNGGDSRNGSDS